MVITYYGHEFFKVQFGDTTIAVNPVSKDSSRKSARFGADIVLVGVNDPEHNGIEHARGASKEPFVVDGPGEYEIGGVVIEGIAESTEDRTSPIPTFYAVSLEGMRLVFLTAASKKELSSHAREVWSGADVLFIPVGGGDVLAPADAHRLAMALEAKLIIPMRHDDRPAALASFLKESGVDEVAPLEKLTLKKKDLAEKTGDVAVLSVN